MQMRVCKVTEPLLCGKHCLGINCKALYPKFINSFKLFLDSVLQILLRKGGIREPTFQPAAARFLLLPTSFHSEANLLKPYASEKYTRVSVIAKQSPRSWWLRSRKHFKEMQGGINFDRGLVER